MKSSLTAAEWFAALLFVANPVLSDPCQPPASNKRDNGKGVEVTLGLSEIGEVSGTYLTKIGCGAGTLRALTGFCDGYG